MHRTALLALVVGTLSLGAAACRSDVPPDAGQTDTLPAASADTGAASQADFIAVGEPAPDFELPGATRYGVLAEPVRLSDYRGKTVVLAFFFRARGRG